MKFKEYIFGYADADKEYVRINNYFDTIFFDPKNHIDELIYGWEFMVVGRKGVGKSAYGAKLRSMQSDKLFTNYLPLNEFEYSTFEKTSTDKNVTGTQKFKESWDFVLLCLIYKTLANELNITEHKNFNDVIELLKKLGFSLEYDYRQFVTSLSKLKLGANLKVFDIEYEKQFDVKPSTYLERISTLTGLMIDTLKDVYLEDKKVMLLLDGVDDVLRFKKNRIEILSSLVRSVDYLNNKFNSFRLKAKIILFIRDEILFLINDTDINKIKRDSSIKIDWTKHTADLKEMVNLRMIYSNKSNKNVTTALEDMFPKLIKEKPFWKYILDLTLYKPRDVIQYFKCCQELFPDKTYLTYSEVNEVTKNYSNQYFMEEMKNEMAGFTSDQVITAIPSVFKKMNTKSFSVAELYKNISKQLSNITIDDVKYLLYVLYEAGYVGQIVNTGLYQKGSVQFKYRNGNTQVDYDCNFIIHQGLYVGLGVKI